MPLGTSVGDGDGYAVGSVLGVTLGKSVGDCDGDELEVGVGVGGWRWSS